MDAATAEEKGLELDRRGSRFASEETETAYQDWLFADSRRIRRVLMLASSVIWLSLSLLLLVFTGRFEWALASIVIVALLAIPLRSAHRRRNRRQMGAALLLSYVVTGTLAVCISRFALSDLAVMVTAAVWSSFFHLATSRERPSDAARAAFVYVALASVLLVRDHLDGRLGATELAFDLWALWASYAVAAWIAFVADADRRRMYRQTRIIEAQKARITRAEAMLQKELSHQVAERSRELGAVLARSDIALDVRRLEPGQRFDARYRIVAALGAGGMGAVYEVERLTDGSRLALKAVTGEVSGASAARFAREAEIGARVRHPNVVSIVDVGVSSGVPFLAMELARGGSLESRRARFGDRDWALPILKQIADGLAALHDAGVVHRDLKPANVLLSGDADAPTVKISDFGISRFGALDEGSSIDPDAATVSPSPRGGLVTGTGVVLGTPLYMAPEAARGGRALDVSADSFALGIIAYELLTGRAPFSVPAMVLAMAGQPIPRPAAIDDGQVPELVAELVLGCMDSDPNARPRARRFREALG